ncbi:MAG: GAF domain-containing protein [Ardenticatenaceae bacterium]|nr:GAF domain-containing protein [Ardenticatenaceae bacterium]
MPDITQARYAENLHQILELNTQLAKITDEQTLLTEAMTGICQVLDLQDITCFEQHLPEGHWAIRATTNPKWHPGHHIPVAIANLLEIVPDQEDGIVRYHQDNGHAGSITALFPLKIQEKLLGVLLANHIIKHTNPYTPEEFPALLQSFTQNLGGLWHNIILRDEIQRQAQAMEILQGQYIDSIWHTQTATLQANYSVQGFQISRHQTTEPNPTDQTHPLLIGDTPFGKVYLPQETQFSDDQMEFVTTLVREMGNALNNAYLLQTTRSYANQLALATDVSRAATTILDQDILIQEVVNLIRSGFDLYYVGLFIVEESTQMAVLRAGTGEAGKHQVEQGHQLKIGGSSMIGTSIAQGKAIVEQDVQKAAAFTFNPLLPHTRSELALPLRTRGRIIGALTVQSVEHHAFSDETVAVLQNLSDHLAIAIETASLFAQTQATLAETSRLYETSRRMSAAVDETAVYEALIDFTMLSELVDAAQIITSQPTEPEFFISPLFWSRSASKTLTPEKRYPRHVYSFWKQLAQNKLITIAQAQTDPRLDANTRQFYASTTVKSCVFIPIHMENEWLGTLALYRSNMTPILDADLQPFRTLADQAAIILANQRLLSRLQTANDQLRQLDQLKTQFLANMSHELRTPLNSIIGFSRVILKGIDGPINNDQEEDLTSIYNNGQHLLRLINEVLDMAKIEAGKMVLTFEPVNLEEAAMAAISTIRSLTSEKGLELTWDIESNLPLIEADPIRLRQILNNLLSNAVKYTDAGHVSLRVAREDEHYVRITVFDTGIGISQSDFDKLFAAFEQIDSSTTRTVGGTGLGLPITKWLVDMHQGTISLESEVGKGSTFHVVLPIERDLEVATEDITFSESLQQ